MIWRMLNVSSGHWADTHGTGELEGVYSDEAPTSLDALLELVDRFARMPPLRSYNPEQAGDHAWLSVIDRGFVFHVYFSDDDPTFELYGPFAPGSELQHRDPYDGSGLAGSMSIQSLKDVLAMLDRGESPREHVQQHGQDVEVVSD